MLLEVQHFYSPIVVLSLDHSSRICRCIVGYCQWQLYLHLQCSLGLQYTFGGPTAYLISTPTPPPPLAAMAIGHLRVSYEC